MRELVEQPEYVCSDSTGRSSSRSGPKSAAEALLRQLAVVRTRIAELRLTFRTGSLGNAVIAAADLDLAWSLLEARVDILELYWAGGVARGPCEDPVMCELREALREVLAEAATYAARCEGAGRYLLAHLRRLAARSAPGGAVIDFDPRPCTRLAPAARG